VSELWGGPAGDNAAEAVGGPGGVTLVAGSAFCISRAGGDIAPGGTQGLYFRDTRFLSRFEMTVDGAAPISLAFYPDSPQSGTFLALVSRGGESPHLLVERTRDVGMGMRERLLVRNISSQDTACRIELFFDADFADLFEVKEARIRKTGFLGSGPRRNGLYFGYRRNGFQRGTLVTFDRPARLAQKEAAFDVALGPRERWAIDIECRPELGGVSAPAADGAGEGILDADLWKAKAPGFHASVPTWNTLSQRSVEDLGVLRVSDPEDGSRAVFAAGIPWFMTVFGRDSIIASWQSLLIDPTIALSTARLLARHQGLVDDPATAEAPGKILHEMRFGERADPSLGGASEYYGSVDSTPLYVMLVGELLRWGVSADELSPLLPSVVEAIGWIRGAGDIDGDRFLEYETRPEAFLWNQGWKDSWDGITFADGRHAEGPIALVEVQGYAYAAFLSAASIYDHLGHPGGDGLRAAAADLRAATLDAFAIDDGFVALALDGDKKPVDSISSNPGHLLWTGLADDRAAASVARRLLEDDCFSGFGIRTLSSAMEAYNPLSYHNGSVWPHDNAICIAGMVRYGLVDEALRASAGLLDAARWFGHRLPELFGGFDSSEYPFPVPYPTACSPQAWAAGSPLLLLRAFLGLEPDLHEGRLRLAPVLPDGVTIELNGLRMGSGRLSLKAQGRRVEVIEAPAGVTVEIASCS
jgi:glycogen debranching enzyme